jgi:hypothetical protein
VTKAHGTSDSEAFVERLTKLNTKLAIRVMDLAGNHNIKDQFYVSIAET